MLKKDLKTQSQVLYINLDDFELNQTGVLSTGEVFKVDEKNNKITLISPEERKKQLLSKSFLKNQTEIPNIVTVDNELISSAVGDFKIDSNKLIANLDLSTTFDDEEIEVINNIYYEVRT